LLVAVSIVATVALIAGVTAWAASNKVVINASHYYSITPSMAYAQDRQAAGGYYVEVPVHRPHGENETGPADNGNVLYCVYAPTDGRYKLWGHCNWYDGCGNSFFVYMDKEATPAVFGKDGTYQAWHWVPGRTYSLTEGWHYIRFQYRQDGAKLDQFILTSDSRYVPVRQETETPTYLYQPPAQ
jgi:hypothetical protein